MKDQAREIILKRFCEMQNIQINSLENKLKVVVSECHAPFLLFCECLDTAQFKSRNNPFDGFFINMIHRAFNTLGSIVSLISVGYLQEAEVLSRTLSESVLTIQYLLRGDVPDNISNYLSSYYVGQQWKNDKWGAVVTNENNRYFNDLITDKNKAEEQARNMCKFFIEQAGGEWPEKPKSLSIEKIYKGLEREIEYRTVYRAMCGQSHHNQEDIVNSLLYSLVDDLEMERKTKAQKHCFSVFICLWGIRYFVETMLVLGNYYKFDSVSSQSKQALSIIESHHYDVSESISEYVFPTGWSKEIIEGI